MPAYLIARVQVTDWDRYREYTKVTPEAIERYGGKFIVRGGDVVTLEGELLRAKLLSQKWPNWRHKVFANLPRWRRTL